MLFRTLILGIVLFSIGAYSSENLTKHLLKSEKSDLDLIIKKKYLRVLTTKNPYDYYMYQGKMKGIQYEMVSEFVNYLNKKYIPKGDLKIAFELVPVDFDKLIPMLKDGKGDFIAVGLTKTAKREKQVSFTVPYQKVDDVIVTRADLSHKDWKKGEFYVQKNSSYANALKAFQKPLMVKAIDPNFNAADVMQFISLKKYNYTLVNSYWAKTIGKRFKNLIVLKDKVFRKNVPIGWATRFDSPKLLEELNHFLPTIKKGSMLGNLLNYKYFNDLGRIETVDFSLEKSSISKYDEYFKKYSRKYKIDWRLLAALCYQESRFTQNIENEWGAIGLFQIKQMTANEPYIKISEISGEANFENNIHAGVKYLAWIKNRYFDSKNEMTEDARLRMMLAAYNAGPRRVLQAINKAKEMKLDTSKWFRNVELAMLEMGYSEPVIYVSEINKYFVSYELLGIKKGD